MLIIWKSRLITIEGEQILMFVPIKNVLVLGFAM